MKHIYLTSDTHFNHSKLHEVWGRPKNFQEKIWRGLQELSSEYLLIHLGDICIGKDIETHARLENLLCRKVLVKGNHDRKSDHWYLNHGWDFVCDEFSVVVKEKRILFSHIPQMYDVEKYDLNVHGHLHDTHHRPEVKDFNGRKFQLISLEYTNYKPVSLKNLIK